MTENHISTLSESIQMYLVTIARLWVDGEPVPISQLAEALSISPVSVNEMCRKLQDQKLVVYQPYKGASLTPEGEMLAYRVLRYHRLWEVFLVEKLGFDYEQAHEVACQLEHTTPDPLADRLDSFLGYPSVNPKGHLIPRAGEGPPARPSVRLAALSVGQRGHVVRCEGSDAACVFLREQGVRPGARLSLTADAEDTLLVQVGEAYISLARTLAENIWVELDEKKDETAGDKTPQSTLEKEESKVETTTKHSVNQMPLHELSAGQHGIVVRVGGQGSVKRRMMDMGLVPGTEVKVVRVAPLGDPVEFEVKGYSLSLRKSEAREITVEVLTE
jgi:DtxR family Mn-dependent transcriptional regulator